MPPPRTTFHSFLDAFRASASSDPHGIPEKATLLLQRESVNQIFRAMWLSGKNACHGTESALKVAQRAGLEARSLLSGSAGCLLCNPEKAGPLLRAVVLSSVKWDDDGARLTGQLWILNEQSLAHVNILLPVGYLEDLRRCWCVHLPQLQNEGQQTARLKTTDMDSPTFLEARNRCPWAETQVWAGSSSPWGVPAVPGWWAHLSDLCPPSRGLLRVCPTCLCLPLTIH